jgi:hypothetical protein
LIQQINTLRKGALEVPVYFRDNKYEDFLEVFNPDKASELPDLGGIKYSINIDSIVPYGPLYNLSETQLKVLYLYLQDVFRKHWIRPSKSLVGAPILFISKKDRGLYLYIDYYRLNQVTIKNRYLLPLINKTLDRLRGAKIFIKLDLKDIYYRVRIRKEYEWKTAFRTRYSYFEYLVIPFGLANIPATFQVYINTVLIGLLDYFVVIYLDDILIYSRNEGKYYDYIRQVLTRLYKNNLFYKLSKCEFDIKEVEFLGFLIGTEGIRTDPEQVYSIIKWPEPESFHNVQVFLGFANFYYRFIYHYSQVTIGLIDLLKGMEKGRKSGPFVWTDEAAESFKTLKKAFTTTPILVHFDPSKKIRIETDISKFAIAGTILQ